MKIIKRNQLIILVISLMLITAGYLNFTADNNTITTSYLTAELGDATLVSSNALIENNEIEKNVLIENNILENFPSTEENSIQENKTEETMAKVKVDTTYFTTSKLERENMYSQMLETYQQIYNNSETTSEQKITAINEIAKINKIKNAIMIAENLILAKGFEDIVIFANDNSISVIIKGEKLEVEQIAQIQNIISRELEVSAEIINISTK